MLGTQSGIQQRFNDEVKKALCVFPKVFDHRLALGLNRLFANAPTSFFSSRTHTHLKNILLVQFFLQHKMEKALTEGEQKPLILKLFRSKSRICCALTCLPTFAYKEQQILNIFHSLLPGVQDIPFSFYTWYHPELSYQFYYLELEKLRGKELSMKELRVIEKSLCEQILAIPPLTPALFWPYNEEESFRQIQLLHREMEQPNELPHISILFQEQTLSSLEFLVHYVRPNVANLADHMQHFPASFDLFWHFKKEVSLPFPIDLGAFSLKVPSAVFDVRGSINLLYARRYIAKYLEGFFGPFRDYNGGLFEKQQVQFETIRVHLSDKVPLFDLFAEKLFYALHPIEARLALSLHDAEKLFMAFSEILQTKKYHTIVQKEDSVVIVKNCKCTDTLSSHINESSDKKTTHAQLTLGADNYCCYLGEHCASQIPALLKKNRPVLKKLKTLRLSLQEGMPPSLNPHLSSGDMRCRVLSKLLFEGLMRLNTDAEPEPAGALEYHTFEDGLRYIFKLRPCFWTNGEKVTAVDYMTSWQRALRDHVSHPELLFMIKNGRRFKEFKCDSSQLGVHAIDAQTLEIILEHPDPGFLHKLAQPFFFPLFGSMREPKWFNGPYLIRNQSRDGLLLERNPYYWASNRLFFEQIEIKWVNDVDLLYQLFQEGKIDWIGDPLSTLSSHLIERLAAQDKLKTRQVNRRFLLHFNTQMSLLSYPQIRNALSLSIERPRICDTIFPYSIPLTHPTVCEKNAEQLFEEGLEELKLTRASFPPLTFTYSHQTGRHQLAHYLHDLWHKKLGIHVELEKIEWNLFRTKLEKGEFEITATIQETLDTPLEFLERFEGNSSWNFSQWKDDNYRNLLNWAKEVTDEQKRKQLLDTANTILFEAAPFTPLFRCTHLFAHHPTLENYFFDQEGCVDFCNAYTQ